jgi:hypothetical protein
MIASLAWKEYREQRPVWLTIALLATVLAFGVLELVMPIGAVMPGTTKVRSIITICFGLSVAYGLVAGALLFAGERESGTLDFLSMAAGRRSRILITKIMVGAFGVITLSLALAAILGWQRAMWSVSQRDMELGGWGWLRELPFWSLYAFIAGVFGSATAGTVMRAVGLGMFYATAISLLALLAPLLVLRHFPDADVFRPILRIALIVVGAVMLYSGYRLFCGIDINRSCVARQIATTSRWHNALIIGLRPVAWLIWQQGRGLMIGMLIAGACITLPLAAGVSLINGLAPGNRSNAETLDTSALLLGLAAWPAACLVIGGLAGLATLGGEQARQAQRFVGDQRLPIGRIWLVKSLVWFVFALMVSLLISCGTSLPFLYRYPTIEYQPMPLWPWRLNLARWLLWAMCLCYGFAFGQFLVLIFQRPVIAGFIGLVASIISVIWVPSLAAGGVHWHTLLLPPFVLIVGSRAMMAAWVAGPAAISRGRAIWAFSLFLFLSSLALGIGQRVWEIPDVSLTFDPEAYAKSLSTPMGSEAGRTAHAALHEMQARLQLARQRYADYPTALQETQARLAFPHRLAVTGILPIGAGAGFVAQASVVCPSPAAMLAQLSMEEVWRDLQELPVCFRNRADRLLYSVRDTDSEMAQIVGFVCEGNWTQMLDRLRHLPAGALFDPRQGLNPWDVPEFGLAADAARILCHRASLRQEEGDLAGALDDYQTSFALILTMANQASDRAFTYGAGAAYEALRGLKYWAVKASRHPELLARAEAMLRHFEKSLPTAVDVDKASYVGMLSFLSQPELSPKRWPNDPPVARDQSIYLAPWEQERQQRLLRAFYAGRMEAAALPFPEWMALAIEEANAAQANAAHSGHWQLTLGVWIQPRAPSSRPISRDKVTDWLAQSWWGRELGLWTTPLYENQLRCHLRAAELRISLIRYAAKNGRPARVLGDLVPAYIDHIPDDPYDGKTFRYRVSAGEEIPVVSNSVNAKWTVHPGQGVLWSVGPDQVDDGGKFQGPEDLRFPPRNRKTGDVIFIVPSVNEVLR